MNKYERIKSDMNESLKNGNKARRTVLADIVAAIDKASIAGKTRVEITDALVNEVLTKYKKTVQEMIDTCPASRAETLQEYKERLAIINEFAPQLITDAQEIENFIRSLGIELTKANRGNIMKELKGKVDMKTANQVLGGMLQ
jgi:uncharacterized protein YqeY